MKRINLYDGYAEPITLALGFFDCMHRGHRQILNVVKEKAAAYGAKSALLTFENNFFSVLNREEKLIYTFDERAELLQSLGLDVLISVNFDKKFMSLSSSEFIKLLEKLNIKAIVCGFDYRFGSDKADVYKLEDYCRHSNINFHVQPPVLHDGIKISATEIRTALHFDRLDLANFYLGDKFSIEGVVEKGRGVGKQIGFPTANIAIDADKLLPLGVFVGETTIDDKKYPLLVNIGAKPTFGIDKTTVEAYIKGYSGDLYGKKIRIYLTRFIRPIQKFENQSGLTAQIKKDLSEVSL